MIQLADFFHESGFVLGTFYPRHCITAVFGTLSTAEGARLHLTNSGFEAERVIAVSGREVIEFDQEHKTVLSLLMRAVSRFFATEQPFNDFNLEMAHQGAGFLIVRCHDEKQKDEAWQMIRNENPVAARYYSFGAIEHLAGDPDTD